MSVNRLPVEMTVEEWFAEGTRRFGADQSNWKFVCPCCGHVASVAEYRAAGAGNRMIGYSCIGTILPTARPAFGLSGPGPCDYAGGGVTGLNPMRIRAADGSLQRWFAFAPADVRPVLVGASSTNNANNGN